MGLGVLEPRDGHHAPGTVTLDDAVAGAIHVSSNWKHGTNKSSHVVLVPQPSDDPNDPLNWSASKKAAVFAIILLGTAFICVIPVSN